MKRTYLAALAFGVASLVSDPAGAQTKLTIGYSQANVFLAAFVAKDQGFFARRGMDVTLQIVQIGSVAAAAMQSGTLQVGAVTTPQFLLSVEGGVDSQIVAGASYQSRANPTIGVVAREGSNIRAPADFRGKRVGLPGFNGVNHVIFLKWLKNGGVDPAQVTFVETTFPQMADLLKGSRIDAATPAEPFLGRIQQTNSGYLVSAYGGEVAPTYLESFYIMTREFTQKNPKVARDFKEAIREAVEWIGKNDAEARKAQVTYLKIPEPVAMSIRMPALQADVQPADVQFWVDLCREMGITKGTATVQQVLYR
ncbi:MAG: ABC transporter substrate-binding protein [Betaproteobacteria bacterium]